MKECEKKYGTARQDADDKIIRHTHFAYWTTKTKGAHSHNMTYLLLFQCSNG